MKARLHSDFCWPALRQVVTTALPVLFVVFISLLSFSCDKPAMVLESLDESDQAFFVSVSRAATLDRSRPGVGANVAKFSSADSSLMITSERTESIFEDSLIVTETFDLSLIHRLSDDSTLDYGSVKFGNVQLNRWGDRFDKWISWNYIAQLTNNQRNSVYAEWAEACDLQRPTTITISQSPDVKDSTQFLYTAVPVKIVNLQTGRMLNTANDLEVVFSRDMQKGAVFSIGSDSVGLYYHFELLRSASKLVIPATYIQSVKGSSSTMKCRIFLNESLYIGALTSEAKSGKKFYHLPMYEIVKHNITVTLY